MRAATTLLRVLHVNKFAHVVGGVETHVRDLMALQRAEGHDAALFSVDDIHGVGFNADASGARAKIEAAATLLWSRAAERALDDRLRAFQPDVVHFHGIYHQLSPSVLRSARRAHVATVMTLHDYKLAAPCYLLFRDGHECTLCVGKTVPTHAVRYRCVKDSISGSALCAVEQAVHRMPYRSGVDAFIVPSNAARLRVAAAPSVPSERVYVVPHGVEIPEVPVDLSKSAPRVLFFGRLAPEKGVAGLLAAWDRSGLAGQGWELVIAGDGAERERLEASSPANTRFLGHVEGDDLVAVLRSASMVAVPSLFPETFGLSAAEAMAHGIPTLVSDRGNLPALVHTPEMVVPANDTAAWASAMRRLASSASMREQLGAEARRWVASTFSVPAALAATLTVYDQAISRGKGARAAA